jgi:hypothetical protein
MTGRLRTPHNVHPEPTKMMRIDTSSRIIGELPFVLRAAHADPAYRAWCRHAVRDGYIAYRAAQDPADAAQHELAELVRNTGGSPMAGRAPAGCTDRPLPGPKPVTTGDVNGHDAVHTRSEGTVPNRDQQAGHQCHELTAP